MRLRVRIELLYSFSTIGIQCIIPLLGTSGNGNLRYSREDPAEIGMVGQSVYVYARTYASRITRAIFQRKHHTRGESILGLENRDKDVNSRDAGREV